MTEEPLNPEGNVVRSRPWHESAEIFISKNFWRIIGAGAIGFIAFIYIDPEIPATPRYAEVVFWTVILGSAPAYVLSARAVDMLHNPFGVVLLDIDARESDAAIWNVPQKRWEETEVVEGDLYRLDAAQTMYAGKQYDPESRTVEGTWRGTMSDMELLRAQEKIAECRGQLEDYAKEGFTIEVQKTSIVRGAVRDISRTVIGSLEEGTIYNGEKIGEAVDEATAKYDFDSEREETEAADEREAPIPDEELERNGALDGDLHQEETDAV